MTLSSGQRQAAGLAGWLLVSFLAAAAGGLASLSAETFYARLDQPAWAPPGSVFGPVWTVLYVLMGIAAWLVWREGGFRQRRYELLLFLAQLAVNALWTWLFFALRLGGMAFIEILLLLGLLMLTIIAFWRVRPWAGILLLPYLAWTGFAAALNLTVWQMNPGLL